MFVFLARVCVCIFLFFFNKIPIAYYTYRGCASVKLTDGAIWASLSAQRHLHSVWVGLLSSVVLWLMMTAALCHDLLILKESFHPAPPSFALSSSLR